MNSFIGWVGGKKLLRKHICKRFPTEIDKYIEVFGGAGWVLFHKEKHAETEIYNDINNELVNLFKCMKYYPEAIVQEMGLLLNSRAIFNYFRDQSTECLTDIQRASRYLYLIRTSYGCKLKTYSARPRKINNIKDIKAIQQRLENVIIENKSFDNLIKQYDSEGCLFYCDPPYFEAEKYYDTGSFVFDEEQHAKLRDILKDIKGRFILSYNDCEFIREMYADFNIESIERQSNLASRYGRGKVYKEVIIRNY